MHPDLVRSLIIVTIFGSIIIALIWSAGTGLYKAWHQGAPKRVLAFYGVTGSFGTFMSLFVILKELGSVT